MEEIINYEEMTKDDLIAKIKSLEMEVKKEEESKDFWFKKYKDTDNRLDALRSIIFGTLTILEQ